MPLDVDRLADAMLEGARALIARATAPLIAANDDLRTENVRLAERLAAVEAREVAATYRAPTKAEIAAALAEAEAIVTPANPELPAFPDLSGFATKADIDAAVEAVRSEIPQASDLSGFATKGDVEAIRESIPAAPDLSGMATKAEVAAVADRLPPPPDLSSLATKAEMDALALRLDGLPVPKDFAPEITALAERIAALPAAPDLSGLATKAEVVAAAADVRRDIPATPEVIHGKDGAGIVEVKQNADGEMIVKLTNGETFNVGKVRGEDGFGFDDLTIEYDGERTLTLIFEKDDRVERKEIDLPIVIDRGVWREGEFKRGDGVTWAGSFWIAQRDTSDKPETSDAWRLSVKRGRDGKNALPREPKTGPVKRDS